MIPKVFFSMVIFLCFSFRNNFAQKKIEIKDPWIRPATKGANSALHFIIKNNGNKPDTLIWARSKLADIVAVHETYKKDNDKTGMRHVKQVVIPSASQVEFKPGWLYVMLLDMQKDFKIGGSFDATLWFKRAEKVRVKALVQETPKIRGLKQ